MYIVTGGAGFIGSAFVWKLNRMGIDDILIVDSLEHAESWKNLVACRFTDYLDKQTYLELILTDRAPEPTAIIHMGACSSTTETDADYLMENNYRYSRVLCEYALRKGARFIHASSAATYGNGLEGFEDDEAHLHRLRPLNMYAYSKHLFDLWACREQLQQHFASLKFFNVFGPNEYHKADMRSVVCKAYQEIRTTGAVSLFKSYHPEYPDGGQKRDFIYVKDCVEVLWWLLEHPERHGIFNLGTGAARTWNDLAHALFAALKLPPQITYIDMPAALRDKYQYFTQAPMAKLRAAGWDSPFTPLEAAVADYVAKYLATLDPYLKPGDA